MLKRPFILAVVVSNTCLQIVATGAEAQITYLSPPVVNGELRADTVVRSCNFCDPAGPCIWSIDDDVRALLTPTFSDVVFATASSTQGFIDGLGEAEHALNYALATSPTSIRFSGMSTVDHAVSAIGTFGGSLCPQFGLGVCVEAGSEADVTLTQDFQLAASSVIEVHASLLNTTIPNGTRTFDWWVYTLGDDPCTPLATVAQDHYSICLDDHDEPDLAPPVVTFDLPAGDYLFEVRYSIETHIQVGHSDSCSAISDATNGTDIFDVDLRVGADPYCPGDTNDDGLVDTTDLLQVLGDWGVPGCGGMTPCAGDVNGDGNVDVTDLLLVLGAWGRCDVVIDNNDCIGAEAMAIGDVVSDSTIGIPDPDCLAATGSGQFGFDCNFIWVVVGGKWYVVTGDGTELTADLCQTPNQPDFFYRDRLSVFIGGCNAIECVNASAGDGCPPESGHSSVTWCSEPGVKYWILVHGDDPNFISPPSFAQGPFTLQVDSNGLPCP